MSLLRVEGLDVIYGRGSRAVRAVRAAAFALAAGEAVGLIGESGSGKSTLARALVGLEPPAAGHVDYHGQTVVAAGRRLGRTPEFARGVQFVFQDASAALNPRMRNWRVATEPALLAGAVRDTAERRALAARLFARTRLPVDALEAFPHALSGGQRQRLAICRALSTAPDLLILDEPTSALDVSVQARILDQLLELSEAGVALLLVSHDLAVVRHLCTRILVMQAGNIVEDGPSEQILESPAHAYTQALVAANRPTTGPLQLADPTS